MRRVRSPQICKGIENKSVIPHLFLNWYEGAPFTFEHARQANKVQDIAKCELG